MGISFSKYVGCGNDFILFDNRQNTFPSQNQDLIATLCHRHLGVGADGVILLEESQKADFKMRIFNSDGTEAEMCGNGIRCLMKFIKLKGYLRNHCTIETLERILSLKIEDDLVEVEMGDPIDVMWNLNLPLSDENYSGHFLNTGVPHLVIFTEEIETVPIATLGAKLRHHTFFQPKGTNVNFVQLLSSGLLRVRTYERGVEEETLSCGTGITASAIAAAHILQIPAPIQVLTGTGEIIEVNFMNKFTNNRGTITTQVTQKGPATLVFEGKVQLGAKEYICPLKRSNNLKIPSFYDAIG